jgi:hypothetical protein
LAAVVTPLKVWAAWAAVWADREALSITRVFMRLLELRRQLQLLRLRKPITRQLEITILIVAVIRRNSKKFRKLTKSSPILKSVTSMTKVVSRQLREKAVEEAAVWEISLRCSAVVVAEASRNPVDLRKVSPSNTP